MKQFVALIAAAFPPVLVAVRSVAPLSESLRAEIGALSDAVERGDVHAVDHIFSLLSTEAKKRSSSSTDAEGHNVIFKGDPKPQAQAASVKSPAPVSLQSRTQKQAVKANLRKANGKQPDTPGACVLDDVIFSMTPDSKLELYKELEDSTMQEALTWVRTGGWWHCAVYGELCTCHGSARMVSSDYSAESTPVDLTLQGNNIKCELSAFNNIDPKPGAPKVCECSHPMKDGVDSFHLHKRLTSKSYLQEVWIFLLRLLGRAKLLPAGTGDRLYSGMQNWAARHNPWNMPHILERVWVQQYVQKVVAPTQPGPRCLEWGDPNNPGKGFNYAFMIPGCTQPIDMQYEPIARHQKTYSVEGNIVYSDVNNLPMLLTAGGDWRVNLIFATQVFEHLYNPEYASKMLFESLLPGGTLVFTAPQQAQFHKIPGDYFRYTKEGCVHLLQNAGFCVPPWGVAGGGDFIFDIARDAGLQVQDFPNEEIKGAFQKGYDLVSDSAITIHAMGFKPPHWACNSAMAPIR